MSSPTSIWGNSIKACISSVRSICSPAFSFVITKTWSNPTGRQSSRIQSYCNQSGVVPTSAVQKRQPQSLAEAHLLLGFLVRLARLSVPGEAVLQGNILTPQMVGV
jgi:hypothetical protein